MVVALKALGGGIPAADEQSGLIEQVRYTCGIGAMQTAAAIPRVIPITHCGPGCADKQHNSLTSANGYQGGGWGGGGVAPSSNATQREVIFGGTERLAELIEATLKILEADLFVVVTGCIPALVGDDVGSVVRDFQKRGAPVVHADTGGFKGNNFVGHEVVTRAIIDQFVGAYDGEREPGLINLWSLLPYQNPFWRGDLAEIKRLLEGIGLRVNLLFGPDSAGVSEWQAIPRAQFNLVLSPWLGLDTAKHLERKYGQPFLHVPLIPIGAKAAGEVLRQIAAFAGITDTAEAFILEEERKYYTYIEAFSEFYSQYRWGLPARFTVAADAAYALALSKFAACQLGLIPARLIVTDNPPGEYRDIIEDAFRTLDHDTAGEVEFIEDSYVIHQRIREASFGHKPPLILGSTWERDLAKEMKGFLLEIGFPASYELVLTRSNVGYRGALTLLEHIYSTIIRRTA